MLVALPEHQRERKLSDRARDSIIAGIVHDLDTPNTPATRTAAITLRSNVDELDELTLGERHLPSDWPERVIQAADLAGSNHGRRCPTARAQTLLAPMWLVRPGPTSKPVRAIS